jgi:CRISPR-associated protein Csd1
MILRRLMEYWQRQEDGLPPGYQRAFLTKKLVFRDGRFLGVVSLSGDTRGKGKDARSGQMIVVPREQPQRTSGVKARLLHDNPEYALGVVGEGRDPKKVAERHAAYRRLLEQAHEATGHQRLATVLRWLDEGGATRPEVTEKIAPGDDLYFEVDGLNPTDDPALRTFWSADKNLPQGFCLVTGELTGVGGAMPYPAKGVPGGQPSGTMLVSVNLKAAESYGLEGNLSSPIGSLAAEAVCNALNRLLASAENSLRINDTVYLYWHRDRDEADALRALKTSDPEDADRKVRRYRQRATTAVGDRLDSPRSGQPARKVERPDFHLLALTANASRIVVRDYHETTLESVEANLGAWFVRLALIGTNGKPLSPPSAFRLAASLYRDSKDIPRHVPVALMNAALNGRPLAKQLLALAVRRNAAMRGPFDEFNRQRRLSYPRLALIKACLTHDDPDAPLTMLNENLPNPAYQCGRLLSILESIQRLAIPGLNATLTDRHYGAASATPGVIFGGLIKDATSAHLPKLRKNRPGAFVALDRRLQQVLSQLEELPRTLDYEGQGYFALGYYHQRAHDVAEALAKRAAGEADAAPTEIDDADATTPEETR